MKKTTQIIFLLLAAVLFMPSAIAKSPAELLQEGLYAEEVEGDLDAAIKIYEKVISDKSSQKSHIAQAMYRQGMCYYKQKDELKTKAIFEKIIAEYGDQETIIQKVKPLLDELTVLDPATLMPPETFLYVELGSPGNQIETIVNMLKGTPFENPLAALGGGQQHGQVQGPGAMLSAFFNPSMMAEFKKVRGIAVGIYGIAQNNPPAVAVLDLGDSDALRGMILAGMGMAGQQAQPIEGMNIINMHGVGGIAHDDKIIIVAMPMERLDWCIKQYKGITSEPTLATKNMSFSRVSRQMRQENAFTCWANADEVYEKVISIIPANQLDEEFHIADSIVDFKNIDDVISYLSLNEKGFEFEADIAFKDGHNCLPYNLIRTPNLRAEGFNAVPAGTIGLFSFALSESDSASAEKIQKKIDNITGLDIGRELFANIEQVTVFVMPPKAPLNMTKQSNPVTPFVGLSITSKNPQKTNKLLTQLLSIAQMATTETPMKLQTGSALAQYTIAVDNDLKLNCYTGQSGKTNIVAFDETVFKSCMSAMDSKKSVLAEGCLREPLSGMTANVSKMGLVNVGGAVRIASAASQMINENPQNPAYEKMELLAREFDNTSVRFYTDESTDNFKLHLSLSDLPPMDKVFPLAMELSKIDMTAKVKATNPEPGNGGTVGLHQEIKLNWKTGASATSHKVYFGTEKDALELLAEVKKPGEIKLPSLQEGKQYFWRVDEVWTDGKVITGDVWSFSIGKLVGWWKLDETEGNIAKDSSDSGNDGTIKGQPKWVPAGGHLAGALDLDGVTNAVEVNDFSLTTDSITITAWINGHRATDWSGIVFSRKRQDNACGIHYGGNNRLHYTWNNNSSGTWGWDEGPEIPDDQWAFVACTIEPSKATLYVYTEEDGLKVANHNMGHWSQTLDNLKLGLDLQSQGTRYFDGLMDDVRIYNYALSKDEIVELYQGR
ncbi:MAG: tetratricopeptide repeat protein [Sedimentisphaerales bacterium]|nr:tetratricopeptide repeat protein [Sedimentisphaerales bacterium]